MIDPLLSLAMSMHSNPGVYALLLGSGISRSAGIPTGWEIVEDLIRRIALLEKEDCGADPAAWYARKYGHAPTYSDLLDAVAKSPAERSQLLRGYFEPSTEEREQHLKVPTAAHAAIAQLMEQGFVRIAVTTNFDRLMEQALEARGVTPTVIRTPDSVDGALPLMHSRHTLIKVHGDYLDTRIKNTPKELEAYDPRVDALLDRVLDECGLIVCGWSAEWDAALRAALERRKSRRFSTYWATRSEPTGEAKRLIGLLKAERVKIKGADEFFPQLAEKVDALREIDRPHPLSAKVAVAQTKKYLSEPKYRIELHDLLMGEIETICRMVTSNDYPVVGSFAKEIVGERIARFETIGNIALAVAVNVCFWGQKDQLSLLYRALARLANQPQPSSYDRRMMALRSYPAALFLYAGGIAALAAGRYDTVLGLMTVPKVGRGEDEQPLVAGLPLYEYQEIFGCLPGQDRKLVPFSERVCSVARNPLREIVPDDKTYEMTFDRFEYLQSLVLADTPEGQRALPGAFGYRQQAVVDLEREVKSQGAEWPPFKAGFFGGDIGRLERAKLLVEPIMKMMGFGRLP